MQRLIFAVRAALCVTSFALSACTLIHIEGDSNTVSGIEGHTGTIAPPSSQAVP